MLRQAANWLNFIAQIRNGTGALRAGTPDAAASVAGHGPPEYDHPHFIPPTIRMSMRPLLLWLTLTMCCGAQAQDTRVVDLPTRPGITQRLLAITPENAKAAVILFTGGDGFVGIDGDGKPQRGGNFLVRSRQLFADQGLTTIVIDAPSDMQSPPYLSGRRQTKAHLSDVNAVIAWLRQQARIPVWLVGTSRGTQSAAWVATQLPLALGGPDGIVLTATVLRDPRSRAVPAMDLDRIRIPVLVAHHRQDSCRVCRYEDIPLLMDKLTTPPRRELLSFDGGISEGDPCQARAWHGFNGIEREVVERIAAWITAS
jgi:dienelactone hydrolase